MKRTKVRVGHVYGAKIRGRVVPVQITYGVTAYGKPMYWIAQKIETGEEVRITSTASLKYEMVQDADGTLRRA